MAAASVFERRMKTEGPPFNAHDIGERVQVNYGSPEEVKDKYLRLQDEHLILKKHAVNQEDKLRKLTTKLTRLLNEKKKWLRESKDPASAKEVEAEELVQDLKERVQELEKQNSHLKEKLLVTRQQVFSAFKRRTPYNHVQSKVDSGRARGLHAVKGPSVPRTNNETRLEGLLLSPGTAAAALPPYAVTLLEDAQNEIRTLEETVDTQRAQIDIYEQEMESVMEQLKVKETEYEEELNTLRSKLTHGKKQHVQENLDLIKLNREIKEKSSKLSSLQAQYADLEEKMLSVRTSHGQLVGDLEEQQKQLQLERTKNLSLQSQINTSTSKHTQIQELQIKIDDLTKENVILKSSNEQLINSAMDPEGDLHIRCQEDSLKKQINQLETVLKGELNDKSSLVEQLKKERERRNQLEEELKVVQRIEEEKANKLTELEKRMKFFTQESEVDFGELEEALSLVQQRKRSSQNELGFLLGVENNNNNNNQDLKKQLKCAEAEYAESASELEKTRKMLLLQYKLNRESQDELEKLKSSFDNLQRTLDVKSQETDSVLQLRETKIQKLERQLRDIAVGTKQSWEALQKLQDGNTEQELIHPESGTPGPNIFEVCMHKVVLGQDGISTFGNRLPSLFITWTFYTFDLQSSSVIKGNSLDFNCSAQYEVDVNSQFLDYLCKESMSVELHQSQGTGVKTLARTLIPLRQIFDDPSGDHHRLFPLIGCRDGVKKLNYGSLHSNIIVPENLEGAIILFKERLKAAGYLESNQRLTATALEALDRPQGSGLDKDRNELHIKILRCKELHARRKGCHPSPFCRYKFLNCSPRETVVIPASQNPEFNDHHTVPLKMNSDLHHFLNTQKLTVYVFDEAEIDKKDYLGKVSISLAKLSMNSPVKGSYSLMASDGTCNGFIDIILYWQFTYTFQPENFNTQGLQRTKQVPSSSEKDAVSGDESVTSVSDLNGSSVLDDDTDLLSTSTEGEESDPPDPEVVIAPSPSRKTPSPAKNERIVISVNSLHLSEGAHILDDPTISLLFVEYRFLDLPPEELETPFALPKPNPPQRISFNFRKVFPITGSGSSLTSKGKLLLDMLNSTSSRLKFTVVSEPPEDDSNGECEDVGYVFVDFKKIVKEQQDILDEDLEIFDSLEEKTVVGYLNVRVEALALLNSLSNKPKQ